MKRKSKRKCSSQIKSKNPLLSQDKDSANDLVVLIVARNVSFEFKHREVRTKHIAECPKGPKLGSTFALLRLSELYRSPSRKAARCRGACGCSLIWSLLLF